MKFYFWLTFIASDHLISGQGGRYRPLLNRAYQSFQREAAKEIPKPPHNPNYRHGNSYNTARKLLFHPKISSFEDFIKYLTMKLNWFSETFYRHKVTSSVV